MEVVVTRFSLLEQEGDVGGVIGTAEGGFGFTLRNLQQADFVITDKADVNHVDVGKLVAFGIHFPVVGVAGPDGALAGGHGLGAPGVQTGVAGNVAQPVTTVDILFQLFEGRIGIVGRIMRGQEVLGAFHREPLPETLGDHEVGDVVRFTPIHHHGVLIREGDFHGGAVGIEAPPGDGNNLEVFIGGQLPPVTHIFDGGEGGTVRPLEALAEDPGEGLTVFGDLPGF